MFCHSRLVLVQPVLCSRGSTCMLFMLPRVMDKVTSEQIRTAAMD